MIAAKQCVNEYWTEVDARSGDVGVIADIRLDAENVVTLVVPGTVKFCAEPLIDVRGERRAPAVRALAGHYSICIDVQVGIAGVEIVAWNLRCGGCRRRCRRLWDCRLCKCD